MKHRLLLVIVVFISSLPISVSAQTPRYARVISENANLRDTPSVSGVSEQEVAEDTLVKVLDERLPWYVVRVGNRVGWMHGNTLEFNGSHDSAVEPAGQQIPIPDHKKNAPATRRSASSSDTPEPGSGGYMRPDRDRIYTTGPRGGCYYLSGSGRKVYVDHSLCN
jgi:hypothetical protein